MSTAPDHARMLRSSRLPWLCLPQPPPRGEESFLSTVMHHLRDMRSSREQRLYGRRRRAWYACKAWETTARGRVMKRREFLASSGIAATTAFGASARSAPTRRPNVLLIMTDQQFADAMSCRIGTKYIHTPAMDRIAAEGMMFTRAYCANPLCVPSRCSMFTGHFPHETHVQHNTNEPGLDAQGFLCMGRVFRDAGYDTGYVGKWHMNFPEDDTTVHGFEYTAFFGGRMHDAQCVDPLHSFLERERTKPFFLVASYKNPHNICQWARGEALPDGPIGEAPPADECPPALPNRLPPVNETDIMTLMRRS
ncbi:MAG TPA: hypothetical protein ENN80_12145, partial [Candidatus Hydrogenedentes bacterium]|nr:hypothetical protein [Candidatus Hydrogenedentota bacterium]